MKNSFWIILFPTLFAATVFSETKNRIPQFKKIPKDELGKIEPRALRDDEQIRALEGPSRVNFTIEFGELQSSWAIMSISLLPFEEFSFHIWDGPENGRYSVNSGDEWIEMEGEKQWVLTGTRRAGISHVDIKEETTGDVMRLNLITKQPWDGESTDIYGYQIGKYQDELYKGLPSYTKPNGFIELTRANEDTWLSPHFRLKQFASRQTREGKYDKEIAEAGGFGVYPKYLLVEPRLLLKLELLVERLQEKGIKTEGLYIHSGFRTPIYNRAIGNRTNYSRHVYGDAADVYVDTNNDRMMDDLDRDGKSDEADATVIFDAVHEILTEDWQEKHLLGGIGFYRSRSFRGPFVHVDTRGYEIHWGKERPEWAIDRSPPEEVIGPDAGTAQ